MLDLIEPKLESETVIIELSVLSISQTKLINLLPSISASLKTFIKVVIEIAGKEGESREGSGTYYVGRKQIQDELKVLKKGASAPIISKHLAQLKAYGIVDFETHNQPKRKKVNHYTINDFSPLSSIPAKVKTVKEKNSKKRTNSSIIHAQREHFEKDKSSLLLSNPADIILFNEQLFNGILDTCMRVSSKDPRKTLEVNIQIGGHPLKITSACTAMDNKQLLLMTDQRAMRCILSYCKKKIEHQKLHLKDIHQDNFDVRMIPNMFNIDIHDLCKLMGMSCVNQSLDIVVGMMDRLSDTVFEVDASENPWFQDSFSTMFAESNNGDAIKSDSYKIRFLNNFESSKANDRIRDLFKEDLKNLRPRFYKFSLEDRLFYSMIQTKSPNIFKSHEGLSSELSGTIHRLYNWARAFLSGRAKAGIENKWFTLDELHSALLPGRQRLDNFRSNFLRALQKKATPEGWVKGEGGKALVYGYYVIYKRENGVDLFNISRDINDEFVGNNSRHNVLIRQEQQRFIEGFEG